MAANKVNIDKLEEDLSQEIKRNLHLAHPELRNAEEVAEFDAGFVLRCITLVLIRNKYIQAARDSNRQEVVEKLVDFLRRNEGYKKAFELDMKENINEDEEFERFEKNIKAEIEKEFKHDVTDGLSEEVGVVLHLTSAKLSRRVKPAKD